MYEHHNSLLGHKPKDVLEEAKGVEAPEAKKLRNIVIPDKIFEDFKELTMENEPAF